jgi:hypothetical protein
LVVALPAEEKSDDRNGVFCDSSIAATRSAVHLALARRDKATLRDPRVKSD